MNKTAIKKYATAARLKLIEAVSQKMRYYGFDENGSMTAAQIEQKLANNGVHLDKAQAAARDRLYHRVAAHGYQTVVEEVAYTWFNRLAAIRFMEVNGYLPSGINVLYSGGAGRLEPECVREYARIDYIDQAKAAALGAESDEALYRYILVKQCNELGKILPGMFSTVTDYAELLLPDRLFAKDCIVYDLANSPASIPADDFNVKEQGQVEIIGWLYQYYISEKKDEVFAQLKKNVKITKENVPAATQLFTPDWIVRYMVENSLGRLWLEGHPNAALQAEWKYYIPDAEQTPEVTQLMTTVVTSSKSPEDIRFIDPCMGSGHILVYAFDVLFQIYVSAGYAERDIPDLILTHNLYGLDIDERACQLTYFALNMKARAYNRRFLRRETAEIPQPHVFATVGDADLEEYGSLTKVTEVGAAPAEPTRLEDYADYAERRSAWNARNLLAAKYDVVVTNPPYMGASGMGGKLAEYVKKNYPDSKSDASTAFMEQTLDLCKPTGYMAMINIPVWMFLSSYEKLRKNILAQNTIANMLHFGRGVFGSDFGTTSFVIGKSHIDGFSASYRRLFKKQGAVDSVEQKERWFFEKLGVHTARQSDFLAIPAIPIAYWVSDAILSLFDIEPLQDTVQFKEGLTTANNDLFLRRWYEVRRNDEKWIPYNKGGEFRKWYGNNELLINWTGNGQLIKEYPGSSFRNAAFQRKHGGTFSALTAGAFSTRFSVDGAAFDSKGTMFFTDNLLQAIGYMNTKVFNHILQFVCPTLDYRFGTIQKMPFLKADVEQIVQANVALSRADWDAFETSWDFKRHPLIPLPWRGAAVGGGVVSSRNTRAYAELPFNPALKERARELRKAGNLAEVLLWLQLKKGQVNGWDFDRQKIIGNYIVDFYCANVDLVVEIDGASHNDKQEYDSQRDAYLRGLGLTMLHFRDSDVLRNMGGVIAEIKKHHPVRFADTPPKEGNLVEAAFAAWEKEACERWDTLKANEEELNRIFIDVYGLRDELTPEVADKDVTVRRADKLREVKSFVSYAVGCMFGRYSLDVDGLAYAGGAWDAGKYTTFQPDKDNVLPINDEADYFDDDIVVRFAQFVRTVYGEATLEDNLAFIGDTLYPDRDGSARDKIRRYFANDFYKDHVKTYQKKPIYWQFDSGKQGGFKALIYLHRYDKYTVGRVRTEYMHPQQRMYDDEIKRIDQLADLPETTAREKALGQKRVELLRKKIAECREYDAVIAHIALQNPEIDLDDGVTANYARFQGVEIALGDGRPPKKMDLLTKI